VPQKIRTLCEVSKFLLCVCIVPNIWLPGLALRLALSLVHTPCSNVLSPACRFALAPGRDTVHSSIHFDYQPLIVMYKPRLTVFFGLWIDHSRHPLTSTQRPKDHEVALTHLVSPRSFARGNQLKAGFTTRSA